MEPHEEQIKELKYRKLFLKTNMFWYSEHIHGIYGNSDDNIIFARFPMYRNKNTEDDYVKNIAKTIIESLHLNRPVLLHCHQGRGRSMVIAAIVVGILYGLSTNDAIEFVRKCYKTRKIRKYKDVLLKKRKINQINRILEDLRD